MDIINFQNIKIDILAEKIFLLYLLFLIIDIGGAFGLKYLSFILIILFLILLIVKNKLIINNDFFMIEGFLFLLLPLLIASYSIMFYSIPINKIIGELTPFLLWLLYPLLLYLSSDKIINNFKRVTLFAGLISLFTFVLLYLISDRTMISNITSFARTNRLGYIGIRNFNFFVPNVYYRWTLILIPSFILHLKDNKFKWIFLFLGIIITFSTAAIFFSTMGLVLTVFIKEKNNISKKNILYIFLLFIGLLFLIDKSVIQFIFSKFNLESNSTSIKVGHIVSILEYIFKNPINFLFGMGIGSEFYSTGINSLTTNVEVSHFNLIRQFGVLYSILFFMYVINLIINLFKTTLDGKLLAIGILMLFIAAGTNPLLISPIFFTVMIISKAYITRIKFEKERVYRSEK